MRNKDAKLLTYAILSSLICKNVILESNSKANRFILNPGKQFCWCFVFIPVTRTAGQLETAPLLPINRQLKNLKNISGIVSAATHKSSKGDRERKADQTVRLRPPRTHHFTSGTYHEVTVGYALAVDETALLVRVEHLPGFLDGQRKHSLRWFVEQTLAVTVAWKKKTGSSKKEITTKSSKRKRAFATSCKLKSSDPDRSCEACVWSAGPGMATGQRMYLAFGAEARRKKRQ